MSNCIYTTEYLKLRTGARSDAIEFRRFDGRILSRHADMLRTMTEQEWHEVDAMQLCLPHRIPRDDSVAHLDRLWEVELTSPE